MDTLPKCQANYAPLTPVTFLKRAAMAYASRTSIIYGSVRFTYQQTYERCCRLASALRSLNMITKNSVVSVLAPNIPAMYEMHFAIPMAGAVLNTMNTRLDPKTIATLLKHSEAKVFFVDYDFLPKARSALQILQDNLRESGLRQVLMPQLVVINEMNSTAGILHVGTSLEYEQLVSHGDPGYIAEEITDEWDAICLNYTSGTTAEPKGVVYSHRGAYLSTLSLILGWEMKTEPVYLWSLPMFHCNGWTFTWGVAARGGTNVCIRNTTAKEMYDAIASHNVTHMCCAPIVFNTLLQAELHEVRPLRNRVEILTGGAPPPAPVLDKIERLGFHVSHAYGLTEATGPALVCEWQNRWNKLPGEEQSKLKARQGVSVLTLADVDIKDPKSKQSMPRDGIAAGEIVIRGSSIMKGYLKDEKATGEAFENGWFRTGDVGVIHPDGYVEIKDRLKDIIISGGENISSVEVESALCKHPMVVEAGVVAMPHPRWGESPCAFIVLKNAAVGKVNEADIIQHCRKNLSGFMIPKKVGFMDVLPRNALGKIEKVKLRDVAKHFVVSSDSSEQQKSSSADKRPVNGNASRIKRAGQRYDYGEETQGQIMALSRL